MRYCWSKCQSQTLLPARQISFRAKKNLPHILRPKIWQKITTFGPNLRKWAQKALRKAARKELRKVTLKALRKLKKIIKSKSHEF